MGKYEFKSTEDIEEERRRFIEGEQKAVAKDIGFTFAFHSGIFLTAFFFGLITPTTDIIITRIVLTLFLVLPFPLYVILLSWNQNYFFDSAGIRLVLLAIGIFQVVLAFAFAYELNGPGVFLPIIFNQTITLLIYVFIAILLFIALLLISRALIQSEEKPFKKR